MHSRRDFLWHFGGGLGDGPGPLARRAGLACRHAAAAPEWNGGLHHKAKVRRVVQLFMNGGVSQPDTFDHKPELIKRHGQKVDFGIKAAATSVPGAVMKSPFAFKQHGHCGRWVSSVFPHLAGCVDDLAFLMAMASKTNVHGPASYMQNTGFVLPGFPCMGAWLSYGLGSLNDNLPAFVVLPDGAACLTTTPVTSPPASCRWLTRALSSSPARPCPSPTCNRQSPPRTSPATARRRGWPCSNSSTRITANSIPATRASMPALPLTSWLPGCRSAPPRCWTWRAKRRRCAACTAWTTSQRPTSDATV